MKRRHRRRIEALTRDREAIRSDRLFFARHPERSCRLRRAFASEREAYARVNAQPIPPGQALFVAVGVHWLAEKRIRAFFIAPRDTETDVPEEVAKKYIAAAAMTEWEVV